MEARNEAETGAGISMEVLLRGWGSGVDVAVQAAREFRYIHARHGMLAREASCGGDEGMRR